MNTATETNIPNFETTDMNRWSTNCTEPVIYAYLQYLRGHMLWLETEGRKLLQREEPLSKDQYDQFMTHLGLLTGDIRDLKPLKTLLKLVIKKGIASLQTLVERGEISNEDATAYMKLIDFHLQPAATFGVRAYDCTESEELIDSLVPIAQACKSEHMLRRISGNRFPGRNKVPCDLYEKHFRNW